MADPAQSTNKKPDAPRRSFPPGRIKIVEALKTLMAEKEFTAITTAEIARTAGVTEALIYKYFADKRDLLHQVLAEYLEYYLSQTESDLRGASGSLNKIRKIVRAHINMYATNRVFAKILLLEVRNYSDYWNSDAYGIVKRYSRMLTHIIEEGAAAGEIRNDVPANVINRLILGGIDQVCLSKVIFGREISVDELTDDLCGLLFEGVAAEEC
jgi:TetR/AcrR family transcriptional regulator, fatty acid metabolism regulator protein